MDQQQRPDIGNIIQGHVDVETALWRTATAIKELVEQDDFWGVLDPVPEQWNSFREKLRRALANADLPLHFGSLPLPDARAVLKGAHIVSISGADDLIVIPCDHGGGAVEVVFGEAHRLSLCARCAATIQGQILASIVERGIERAFQGKQPAIRV